MGALRFCVKPRKNEKNALPDKMGPSLGVKNTPHCLVLSANTLQLTCKLMANII